MNYDTLAGPAFVRKWRVSFSNQCLAEVQHHSSTRGLDDYAKCVELHPGSGNEVAGDCRRSFASLLAGGLMMFAYNDGYVSPVRPEIDTIVWKSLASFAGEEVVPQEDL